MKYIDADKLIAEIENLNSLVPYDRKDRHDDGLHDAYYAIIKRIQSLRQEQSIKVYRVENEKEQKGLWRKFDGTWEPLFDMLTDGQCKDMPMEDSPIYREGGRQWFASAPSKETLQKWFSKRDLEELTAKGFTISEFEVVGHKKISDFEYIFTRDNIISKTYLKVSDIYPQEQPSLPEGLEDTIQDWIKRVKDNMKNPQYRIENIVRDCVKAGALCKVKRTPLLPQSLDEAADTIPLKLLAENKERYTFDSTGMRFPKDCIKAGAEWMAGQGVSIQSRFHKARLRDYISFPILLEDGKDFNDGEEVIVQIHKK